MFRNAMMLCTLMLTGVLFAQNVTQEMDYGDNSIEWRIFESEGAVTAFTVVSGTIWYSTGVSVGELDMKTNKSRAYPTLGSASGEGIKTIAHDGRKGVWFGGVEGAIFYANNKFTTYTKENGLADNAVNVIYCTGGSVWVGTENGLSQLQGSSWKSYTVKDGLCGNKIRDITDDGKGGVWFATNKGIAGYTSGQWKTFDVKSGLSSNDVKAIAYDTRKKEMWAAAGEQDVNNYNGKEWNVFMDIMPGLTSIMSDTQSRIWFGSTSGIIKYNGFEWVTDPAKVGFPATLVNDMYIDNKGDLYFALENGVLHMKNPYPY